ncbi:MAG: cob(I)yrinic acid a,c-diamide adenosyltransferase [Bacteroidales bacterium]|jgi:cob(I)alamin adenosyltransferase
MIHVYTGNGKGKTTAAIGMAVRAAGAGNNVFFAQFVKGKPYSELNVLKNIPSIVVKQYGLECFIVKEPTERDIQAARNGLKEVKSVIQSGSYGVIILDEACIALYYHLFTLEELLDVINLLKPYNELIITGRYAPEALIALADLVTEMKEIKHYYTKGTEARKGIEY